MGARFRARFHAIKTRGTELHRALKPWLFRLPNDSIPWFDRSFETKGRGAYRWNGEREMEMDVNGEPPCSRVP